MQEVNKMHSRVQVPDTTFYQSSAGSTAIGYQDHTASLAGYTDSSLGLSYPAVDLVQSGIYTDPPLLQQDMYYEDPSATYQCKCCKCFFVSFYF